MPAAPGCAGHVRSGLHLHYYITAIADVPTTGRAGRKSPFPHEFFHAYTDANVGHIYNFDSSPQSRILDAGRRVRNCSTPNVTYTVTTDPNRHGMGSSSTPSVMLTSETFTISIAAPGSQPSIVPEL